MSSAWRKTSPQVVFERRIPAVLVAALAAQSCLGARQLRPTQTWLPARHAALIFLYRLLFILYAEDRNLLARQRQAVRRLRSCAFRVRDHIAARMDAQGCLF